MKALAVFSMITAGLAVYALTGCARNSTKSPDVTGAVRDSLNQAGLKDVSVSDDRDNGVVTLGGHVASDDAKRQTQAAAQAVAGGQVVANQVAVIPAGVEKEAKTVNSDLDHGIEKNLDAALVASRLNANLKYDVKNRVVVLKGAVDSEAKRAEVAKVAAQVPNVAQVVNEVQVRDQKATAN